MVGGVRGPAPSVRSIGLPEGRKVKDRIQSVTLLAFLGWFLSLPHADLPLFAEEVSIAQESQRPKVMETIAFGLESAYPCRIPTMLVIRDQEDWLAVWNLHLGREASQHQLPDIDFAQFSVIALFGGRRSSTEGVEIVRFEHPEEGAMAVYAVELEAGLGCMESRIPKNPFHIVRVPAVKKHATPSLEIEILSRHCMNRDGPMSPR